MGRVFVRASQYRLESFPGTLADSPLVYSGDVLIISACTFLTAAPFNNAFGNGFAIVYRGNTNRTVLNYSLAYYLDVVWLSTVTLSGVAHLVWTVPAFAAGNRYDIACGVDFSDGDGSRSRLYINGVAYGPGTITLGTWDGIDPATNGVALPCIVGAERTTASTFANAYAGTIQDVYVAASDIIDTTSAGALEILRRLSIGTRPAIVHRSVLALDAAVNAVHTRITGATPEFARNLQAGTSPVWDPVPGPPTPWETSTLKMIPPLGTRPWVIRPGRAARARGAV